MTRVKTRKTLPKTAHEISNGGLYRLSVRCGKVNCKCAKGELHPGYWYFITRIEGKLHKYYIPKDAVEGLAKVVAEARAKRAAYRQSLRDAKRRLTEIGLRLREISSL